jgi:hypothetical protein
LGLPYPIERQPCTSPTEFAINASITKFERLKYQKTISSFSYTDEAFALLMVVNYEARWTSQYEAIAGYPAESRED